MKNLKRYIKSLADGEDVITTNIRQLMKDVRFYSVLRRAGVAKKGGDDTLYESEGCDCDTSKAGLILLKRWYYVPTGAWERFVKSCFRKYDYKVYSSMLPKNEKASDGIFCKQQRVE